VLACSKFPGTRLKQVNNLSTGALASQNMGIVSAHTMFNFTRNSLPGEPGEAEAIFHSILDHKRVIRLKADSLWGMPDGSHRVSSREPRSGRIKDNGTPAIQMPDSPRFVEIAGTHAGTEKGSISKLLEYHIAPLRIRTGLIGFAML
jgi:hypothetical protein